ncbi:MAG TPA: hypothetical protein VMF31_11950 [Solirubrobacterales bacterium]|nr:hypothetical protein [Solirubrobacterales bacterium]
MNHHSGLSNVRRIAVMTFALLMALAMTAAVAAGPADAKKKPKKAKVSLTVTTKNQAALLKGGKLTVKVKSTAKAKVKVSASNAGKTNRFKSRTVKFKKKGTKTISLALTSSGKSALKTCGAKTVKVTASYKKGKKKAKATKSKNLAKDSTRCVKPVEPVKAMCDPLDPAVCLQPFPNNYYTKSADTKTGVQLDLPLEGMPKNQNGKPIDQTDINRADGFSSGNMIITKIPEVSTPAAFNNTGFVPITDIPRYADADQAAVVIDVETGQRQPIWAELDSVPTTKPVQTRVPGQAPEDILGGYPNDNPSNTGPVNLIIRPAKNFTPGHRYVVALRNLKDASNNDVQPAAPFKSCRDGETITDPALLFRCNSLNKDVFPVLQDKGISKDGLYLAWDFTVASEENITGRALDIRDDAFKRLGDTNLADRTIAGTSPQWTIQSSTDSGDPGSTWYRNIEGELQVPCYIDSTNCDTGGQFKFNADGSVDTNTNTTDTVPFRCRIPRSVTTETPGSITPASTGIYGHGLLGSFGQVNGQDNLANRSNTIWCAVSWAGFASEDFGTVAASLKDLSNFNKLTDRMQQGFVNFMYLQRALVHPNGLATDAAFQVDPDGPGGQPASSAIDTSDGNDQRGMYMGISQGGIMGGALTALLPDSDVGVLGVPAINYSTLLQRSVDFDEYAQGLIDDLYLPNVGLYDNYPNELERPMIFSIMQLLWDRGEGNGYVQSLNPDRDPLPNTPPHTALLQLALGDHQVANVAAEVEARTIGAKVLSPTLIEDRHWGVQLDNYFEIPQVVAPIAQGNTMVYYDGGPEGYNCTAPGVPAGCRGQGSKVPPNENVPPRPQWGYGGDPHGYPRASEDGLNHAESFLKGDGVGPCQDASGYCLANGWDGEAGLP